MIGSHSYLKEEGIKNLSIKIATICSQFIATKKLRELAGQMAYVTFSGLCDL